MKSCPATGKTCKNCNKPNHFARMCRSQQINDLTDGIFQTKVIELDDMSVEQIEDYIADRMKKRIN